jgi:hypothetical protein
MRQQAVGNRQQRQTRARLTISDFRFAISLAVACFALTHTVVAAPVADPFADQVISYSPGPDWSGSDFLTPLLTLGPPSGMYVYEPDNSSLATLGDGGNIVLKFNTPIENNPRNPYGQDFIVFGNPQVFETLSGFMRWQELAFVEISQNGSTWYLIKPSILPANLRAWNGTPLKPDPHNYDLGNSYTAVSGYAEYTPTVGLPQALADPPFAGVSRTNEELYTVPDRPSAIRDSGYTNAVRFDFVSGGGDGFDIANAVVETAPGVPMIVGGQTVPAGIDWFSYVRITDARTGDSWPLCSDVSADIDAVSRTRPALSIGEAKNLSTGDYALVTEAIVTAVFTTEFFMESPDRSAAMRVAWDGRFLVGLEGDDRALAVGDKITITGHLSKANSRFSFDDPMLAFTAVDSPLPKPLGVPVQNLDSNLVYGMRVRTWGRISDPGSGWQFAISEAGKNVAATNEQYKAPMVTGTYVSVTGICDREEGTGSTVLRVIDPANDIRSYP